MPDHSLFHPVLRLWGRTPARMRPDLALNGSPERSARRLVLEDTNGQALLLEEFHPADGPAKRRIAARLRHLHARSLPVAAPLPGLDGHLLQETQGGCWQLTPYLPGLPLDHATYWREAWRGEALATYLVAMRQAASNLDLPEPSFDLPAYVARIAADSTRLHPGVARELQPVWPLLQERLPALHAALPVVFSHGDPHPGNMLWGELDIRAAIDWEFCGPKHLLYDPALIIGCVGSEAPEARRGPLVRAFVDTLLRAGLLDATGCAALPVLILAQRTAWLAEWLRREDRDMIDFEIHYMRLLAADCMAGNAPGLNCPLFLSNC